MGEGRGTCWHGGNVFGAEVNLNQFSRSFGYNYGFAVKVVLDNIFYTFYWFFLSYDNVLGVKVNIE